MKNSVLSFFSDLATFFTFINEGPNVTVSLLRVIPENSIPENHIIILELRASAPNAISAHTTIIFDIIEEVNELVFNQAYYTGYYSESDRLVFDNEISLTEGYDDSVSFSLEGGL